jgi:hypothetical protein
VNEGFERIWKERSWPILRYYPEIRFEGLRKNIKSLSEAIPVQISVRIPAILTEVSHGFPQYFQVNAGLVP